MNEAATQRTEKENKEELDSSRVLLAVVLSIILVVAYQELVLKRFFPPPTQQQQQAAEQAKAAKQAQALGYGTCDRGAERHAGSWSGWERGGGDGAEILGDDAVDGAGAGADDRS